MGYTWEAWDSGYLLTAGEVQYFRILATGAFLPKPKTLELRERKDLFKLAPLTMSKGKTEILVFCSLIYFLLYHITS